MLTVVYKKTKQEIANGQCLKTSIHDMQGTFLSPPYRDRWISCIRDPDRIVPFQNHWLVRQSAAKAFALELVKLDRLLPSMVEVNHQISLDERPSISNTIDSTK